ncbi:hypothetical protein ACIGQE_27770 [Streptomyces sp. NPDC053429]|uniref:hypothetical protein n=1 Tax=Streptomyces sp. NPDC053429 TaxID=3365702 RepID=UPI0037CE416C
MDIVYLSLEHRPGASPEVTDEAAEALGALWAHAAPDDGLEHAHARVETGRIDLLLFLTCPRNPGTPGVPGPVRRAANLLARCYSNSPALGLRYLPPVPTPSAPSR